MIPATPNTAAMATMANPMRYPILIHMVRRTPMLIPRVIANVIHMPGLIEKKNKVGIKTARTAISGIRFTFKLGIGYIGDTVTIKRNIN